MSVRSNALVDAFSDNVGRKQAEEIVESAAEECNLDGQRQFSQDEAVELVEQIGDKDDVPTFVSVSANTLKTRIKLGEL